MLATYSTASKTVSCSSVCQPSIQLRAAPPASPLAGHLRSYPLFCLFNDLFNGNKLPWIHCFQRLGRENDKMLYIATDVIFTVVPLTERRPTNNSGKHRAVLVDFIEEGLLSASWCRIEWDQRQLPTKNYNITNRLTDLLRLMNLLSTITEQGKSISNNLTILARSPQVQLVKLRHGETATWNNLKIAILRRSYNHTRRYKVQKYCFHRWFHRPSLPAPRITNLKYVVKCICRSQYIPVQHYKSTHLTHPPL